jgi:hypothetical protein
VGQDKVESIRIVPPACWAPTPASLLVAVVEHPEALLAKAPLLLSARCLRHIVLEAKDKSIGFVLATYRTLTPAELPVAVVEHPEALLAKAPIALRTWQIYLGVGQDKVESIRIVPPAGRAPTSASLLVSVVEHPEALVAKVPFILDYRHRISLWTYHGPLVHGLAG